MSLLHWINDALLTVFFLVVGLEIKREFTVGHLASRRSAALPIAAAIGGMAVPALIYVSLVSSGAWHHGWGVPMATDTAFAVALIAMMGARVPVELRIFLTAAAIVDDIGAIIVVALFYSGALNFVALGGALLATGVLVLLNRSGVYRVTPYVLTGIALWACVHAGGLHATLAGVCWLRLSRRVRRLTTARWWRRPMPSSVPKRVMAANSFVMDRPRPRCASSMRFMIGSSRLRIGCCATWRRARVFSCCRFSRWRMRAW